MVGHQILVAHREGATPNLGESGPSTKAFPHTASNSVSLLSSLPGLRLQQMPPSAPSGARKTLSYIMLWLACAWLSLMRLQSLYLARVYCTFCFASNVLLSLLQNICIMPSVCIMHCSGLNIWQVATLWGGTYSLRFCKRNLAEKHGEGDGKPRSICDQSNNIHTRHWPFLGICTLVQRAGDQDFDGRAGLCCLLVQGKCGSCHCK